MALSMLHATHELAAWHTLLSRRGDARRIRGWAYNVDMTQAVRIAVYVQPRASKSAVAGLHDGYIKIRLAAPPVDGAANQALIEFVAARLGIAKSRVKLVSGASSRRKTLEIEGVEEAQVRAKLS